MFFENQIGSGCIFFFLFSPLGSIGPQQGSCIEYDSVLIFLRRPLWCWHLLTRSALTFFRLAWVVRVLWHKQRQHFIKAKPIHRSSPTITTLLVLFWRKAEMSATKKAPKRSFDIAAEWQLSGLDLEGAETSRSTTLCTSLQTFFF